MNLFRWIILSRSTFDRLVFEQGKLRSENAILARELRTLRTRFAAQILYGETAPKDPRAAAEQAFANVNGYTVGSVDLSEDGK
jgi:hypothetical protein